MKIFMLKNKGKVMSEIRPAYFLKAFDEEVLNMRIFSFGKCNYSCDYCKRGGYDKDNNQIISGAIEVSEEKIFKEVDDAINKGQVIRLSGGDPVCYPELSLRILKYAKDKGGVTSIAHNGSGTEFVRRLIPYLDFASIDLKGDTAQKLSEIIGIGIDKSINLFENTIETIRLLTENNIKTDVRTCIFSNITYEDLDKIAKILSENCKQENLFWTLRMFSSVENCDKESIDIDTLLEYCKRLSASYKELKIGLRAKWEPEGFIYF